MGWLKLLLRSFTSSTNDQALDGRESKLKKACRTFIGLALISWMALYPIYNSFYKANAVEHYQRHLDLIEGKSMFFNPWQYRILCPLIIEGMYSVADRTVFELYEVKGIYLSLPESGEKNGNTVKLATGLRDPHYVKYTLVFLAFRFVQNLLIFYLCFIYFSVFIKSRMLVMFGLMLAALFMGNGVMDADLTFNTYMDVIIYLLAALVIVKSLPGYWIIPITIVGAANRETSLLIPAIYFFSKFSWQSWPALNDLIKNNARVLIVSVSATLAFFIVFVYIRSYFGYQPVSVWRAAAGLPMLKLNLLSSVSIKTYMELFGIFALLPVWSVLIFKSMHSNLKVFFVFLVVIWIIVHLLSATSYQTRLFLVPTLVVLIPSVLAFLENKIRSEVQPSSLIN